VRASIRGARYRYGALNSLNRGRQLDSLELSCALGTATGTAPFLEEVPNRAAITGQCHADASLGCDTFFTTMSWSVARTLCEVSK
jgi:hypothetical protein